MSKSLALILHEKALLEAEFEESGGEITGELDKVWENNQIELAEKVDNYAWVLKHLDSVIANLKERKNKATQIIKSTENLQKRIKDRLNYYCVQSGGPLRGHEYSFHPYLTKSRAVIQSKVEDKYRKVVIEMPLDEYRMLAHLGVPKGWTISHPEVKVSELPEDHPAITKDETPSVRMR